MSHGYRGKETVGPPDASSLSKEPPELMLAAPSLSWWLGSAQCVLVSLQAFWRFQTFLSDPEGQSEQSQ